MAPPALSATMTPELFRKWRKSLGLKQKDAAEVLGLKKRMIQYYEKGDRNGRPVEIPKAVRLACYALSAGIADFDGATPLRGPVQPASSPSPGQPARGSSDPVPGT